MKVLVTGPTGAVGQYILEMLMTTGYDVRVLALPDSMHRINFRDRIEMVPGELSDDIALEEALKDIDIVFHAALVSPPPAMKPETMNAVNIEGTRNLLKACAGKIKRFVLVSSNNVYAPHRSPAMWPLLDDALRQAHGNPQQAALGESLIAAEDLVFEAAERGEIEYSILRPTVTAGRKCPFIESMVTTILRNPDNLEMQRRMWDMMQWSHGTDIASAALLVAEHEKAVNQCFLVAGAEPVTIYDVQALMWEVMNVGKSDNPYAEIASRNNMGIPKFEPRKLHALGWRPQVGVKQCIAEVLGRLEFYSSAAIKMPAHLLDE
ncbi:NAD-dependent epimerase/dehydratase family protein [Actibacterium lipolyticum]|uniref:3 beta-hydroxysteroid dehydrogenase/Delta 5-->4-isomerase n=1 Tax=Actibacterium lipolyticum TaxID=1524263 RepID=A0A238JX49_9RHOB|nr:NAD(P)-dependent oxidoreductase [Actibacterium lipolyticum]SMX34734.1 3 beta-hydroxysteroid dehydrogenase/Delta 5-->4-isomerase [Actibacterium lipolyticum]